jgi:hypothetical protein
MQSRITVSIFLISTIVFVHSCKKDKTDTDSDNKLYSEVKAAGYTFYQNGAVIPAASQSPHGPFRLRFNAVAQSALDSTGELPAGSSFPNGSIIVKEIQSGGNTSLYSVIKKDPSNGNAASGWIWAEFNTDGSAHYSTGKKGDGCTGCHSTSPNRDLVRTFDLH